MKAKNVQSVIHADGVDISVVTTIGSEDDFISLTIWPATETRSFRRTWLRIGYG